FDETTALRARSVGTELTLAVERELISNVAVATLNLTYQPEWTHFSGEPIEEQESILGVAFGAMGRLRPNFLLGGEARYFRRYDGIGLETLAGQALFVGPTAYFQMSERSRLTATWSVQAWGRSAGSNAALDLVNFERHQARLVFGVNFWKAPTPACHSQGKLRGGGFVCCCAICSMNCTRGYQDGRDIPDHHRLCRAPPDRLRGEESVVLRERVAAAMRHGGTALHRAMGGRASEVDRGEMALRISAQPREDLTYLLQSFRSLSAIENTASALISILRTTHWRASG